MYAVLAGESLTRPCSNNESTIDAPCLCAHNRICNWAILSNNYISSAKWFVHSCTCFEAIVVQWSKRRRRRRRRIRRRIKRRRDWWIVITAHIFFGSRWICCLDISPLCWGLILITSLSCCSLSQQQCYADGDHSPIAVCCLLVFCFFWLFSVVDKGLTHLRS